MKEVVDKITMSSHSDQNSHPPLRNMSSRASRVLRKSDSDDNAVSYLTTVGFSVVVNHYRPNYSDDVENYLIFQNMCRIINFLFF